jgi:hypothetical protein
MRYMMPTMVEVLPTGSLMKADGLLGAQIAAEAVVVDDLHDLRLIRTRDGLGELVVIHQHELHARHIDEIGLGKDAEQLLGLFIDDGKQRLAGMLRRCG